MAIPESEKVASRYWRFLTNARLLGPYAIAFDDEGLVNSSEVLGVEVNTLSAGSVVLRAWAQPREVGDSWNGVDPTLWIYLADGNEFDSNGLVVSAQDLSSEQASGPYHYPYPLTNDTQSVVAVAPVESRIVVQVTISSGDITQGDADVYLVVSA